MYLYSTLVNGSDKAPPPLTVLAAFAERSFVVAFFERFAVPCCQCGSHLFFTRRYASQHCKRAIAMVREVAMDEDPASSGYWIKAHQRIKRFRRDFSV